MLKAPPVIPTCRQLWDPQICWVSWVCCPRLSLLFIIFRCVPLCTQYKVQEHSKTCVSLNSPPIASRSHVSVITAISLYFFWHSSNPNLPYCLDLFLISINTFFIGMYFHFLPWCHYLHSGFPLA